MPFIRTSTRTAALKWTPFSDTLVSQLSMPDSLSQDAVYTDLDSDCSIEVDTIQGHSRFSSVHAGQSQPGCVLYGPRLGLQHFSEHNAARLTFLKCPCPTVSAGILLIRTPLGLQHFSGHHTARPPFTNNSHFSAHNGRIKAHSQPTSTTGLSLHGLSLHQRRHHQ